MALEKQTVTGQIEVGETGTIGLRTDTVVLDVGAAYHHSPSAAGAAAAWAAAYAATTSSVQTAAATA